MVKATVITDRVFQTELVIKMIEPREESKEGLGIVRRVVQLVHGLIISMFSSNQIDKLDQMLWLINNLKKETPTPTKNTSEHQKAAHKEQA